MKVHQAVFGSSSRGHMLLAASSGEELPLQELEQRTDLPVSVHEAIEWQPYDSGYPVGTRWYALARTAPDPQATRVGQVITHVLLFPREELSRLGSLQSVRSLLPRMPERLESVAPILVEETRFPAEVDRGAADWRIRAALAALLGASMIRGTAAWRGQEGFDHAVDEIWACLWPAARRGLSFRLAFRPDDTEDDTPTLVVVPESAARLWWHGHPMVEGAPTIPGSGRPALDFLTGGDGRASLASALEAFGGELTDLASLLRLEKAAERYSNLEALSTDEARALARLVGLLSPDPASGGLAKTRILDRLVQTTATDSANAILGLRNLELDAFPGGVDRVRAVVETWSRRELSAAAARPASDVVVVVQAATEDAAEGGGPWAETGVPAVTSALNSLQAEGAARVWQIWQASPGIIPVFADSVASRSMRKGLAGTCPDRIPDDLSEVVRRVARERRWPEVHACAAAASLSAADSVDAHLTAFPDAEALDLLAARLAPRERVREALRTRAASLVDAAVDALVSDSRLLGVGRPDAAPWQDLVSRAAIRDPGIWERLPEPEHLARGVLDRIRDGTAPVEAQHALAESPFASLLAASDRARLWTRLDPRWREVFLARTAEAYLRDLWHGRRVPEALEAPLQAAVWSALHEQLVGGRVPEAETMSLLARELRQLDEATFIQWMHARLQRPLLAAAAEAVGAAIGERGWSKAARVIAQRLRDGDRELHAAYDQCSHLLDAWTRLITKIFVSPRSEGEHLWWSALEEVLIGLYPTGPMEREVWSRAGGDTDKLDLRGSGRDQWHRAVELVRRGGGGKHMESRKLLRMAEHDFPRSEPIRDLIARGF